MKLDLNIGDIILTGKFRNKPVEVAGFDKDENNQPVILTKDNKKVKILCVRIEKLMPKKAVKESSNMKKNDKKQSLLELYNIYIKEQTERHSFDTHTEYDTTISDEDYDTPDIIDDPFIDSDIQTDEENYKEKISENLIDKYIIKKILE